ncbi:MAG: VanZ family protein [Bacteroidota bacterium]
MHLIEARCTWAFHMLLIVYLGVVLYFLFLYQGGYFSHVNRLEDDVQHFINLIPFKTITFYISHAWEAKGRHNTDRELLLNIFGNILLFFPFGVLVPLVFRKLQKARHLLALALGFSFLLEFAQILFNVGNFDIDDIILNTLGALLGVKGLQTFTGKIPLARNQLKK